MQQTNWNQNRYRHINISQCVQFGYRVDQETSQHWIENHVPLQQPPAIWNRWPPTFIAKQRICPLTVTWKFYVRTSWRSPGWNLEYFSWFWIHAEVIKMQPASPPVRRVNRTSELRTAKMPRGFRILGMWIILCARKKLTNIKNDNNTWLWCINPFLSVLRASQKKRS